MGRIMMAGVLVLVASLSAVRAGEPQDEGAKTDRKSTIKAISALAGQVKVEPADSEVAPAIPAGGVRALKALAGNAEVERQQANNRAGQPERQEHVRGQAGEEKMARQVQGRNQVGQQRQVWRPAGGFDGPFDIEPFGFQQWGGNPGFGPWGGGLVWSPAPYQPAFFGGGTTYRLYGYGGFGYQGYYSCYGYYFPPLTVGSVSGPTTVRYADPLGLQQKQTLEAIRKNASNPPGLPRPLGF